MFFFLDFQKYKVIDEASDLPSARTLARSALKDVYDVMRRYIEDHIAKGPRFACITFDLWTDKHRRRSYITFTYHHITAKFKLESFTLSTHLIKGTKDGMKICDEITLLKDNFGLELKKLHSVTDRGGNVQRCTFRGPGQRWMLGSCHS